MGAQDVAVEASYARPTVDPQPLAPQDQPAYAGYPPNVWGSSYYPPGYYPPHPPYPWPMFAYQRVDNTAAIAAGVVWTLVLVRDLIFLAAWLVIGASPFFNPFGP